MRSVAISYSKLREDFGAIGVTAAENRIYVNMARRWHSSQVAEMANSMLTFYNRVTWPNTYIDQITGEYLIDMLKKRGIPTKVISTQKNIKDAKKIEKIKVMDRIEMTEFLRKLKNNGQLRFPVNPSKYMQVLENQIPMFAKHTTEAGGVDYYAPGEEPDDLVRALMIACFSVRNYIDNVITTEHILGGVPKPTETYYESGYSEFEAYI